MTRKEFYSKYADSFADTDPEIKLNIELMFAHDPYIWYHHKNPSNFKLTYSGLLNLKKYSIPWTYLHVNDRLHTPALTLQLSKIPCPWYSTVGAKKAAGINSPSDGIYFTGLYIFGEQEVAWAILCGQDFDQFIKTWC